MNPIYRGTNTVKMYSLLFFYSLLFYSILLLFCFVKAPVMNKASATKILGSYNGLHR